MEPSAIISVQMGSVVSVLQTALTPAFLLVALGSMLNLFTGRLARIVDRTRMLETSYNQTEGNEHDRVVEELRFMEKRMQVVSRAIWFGVASAVVVCMIIGMLFVAGLTKADLALVIAATFVLALALLAGALSYFLREVQISTRTLHVRAEYLELESKG